MSSNEIDSSAPAQTVAAIDIGANALRMVIAEVYADGQIETIERLQRGVRLGQDTFRRGRLGGESMRAAVKVLHDYKQRIDLYDVKLIRAVATTSVRNASNADMFIDRVFMATGLHLDVIDPAEESRLTVSAVRQAVLGAPGVERNEALIVEVGGGSTLLTVLQAGEIATSQSLRLGSILLQEALSTSEEPPERTAELLRHHITNSLATVHSSMSLDELQTVIAIGGDMRFVASQIGKPTESADLIAVDVGEFDRLVDKCEQHTAGELSRRYGLPFAEAETLNPALLVYQLLLHKCRADSIVVSNVSMRDGLLLELAREVTGEEDEALLAGVIHSATAIGEKYRVEKEHAKAVEELSSQLFDELKSDHGLPSRYRLLLRIASLLHEAGSFVSDRAHHKHSYYLISNSEIFGLNRLETEIVAQVARYHRRSAPKASHTVFMALPRETRVAVTKLAAIVRVADALVRGGVTSGSEVEFNHEGDELMIRVPAGTDVLLTQRGMNTKGGLFEDVFGLKIHLEEV